MIYNKLKENYQIIKILKIVLTNDNRNDILIKLSDDSEKIGL